MKSIKYFAVVMTMAASFSTFAAAPASVESQKMGTVSVSGATNLDNLQAKLQEKAEQAGAKSIRIISAGGDNKLFGVAEIYN
jgi:ABC-type phosphate transport system substrate-binding protein